MERTAGKKASVWKLFINLIRSVRLPYVLIGAAFVINLLRAWIELQVPEKLSALSGIDLSAGGDAVKTAVTACLVIFALALAAFLAALAAVYISYIAKAQIHRELQLSSSAKVFSLSAGEIEARDPREFISRITTDTGFVSDFLIDLMVNEIPRLFFLISTIIRIATMKDPVLVLSFVLVVPVIILGSFLSGRFAYRTQNRLQRTIAELTAKLAEKVNNVEIIKAYNNARKETEDGNQYIDVMRKAQRKTTLAEAFNQLMANILFIIPTLIIMFAGVTELLNGKIDLPSFIAYFALGATYQKYIADHLTVWVLAKKAQGATHRISEVMALENEQAGEDRSVKAGTIVFDHVNFRYGEDEVLKDVSFSIPAGKKTAIVGASGSGKSTILNLIEQFYRPQSGKITMDGKEVSEFEIRSYRGLFSYLPQNAPGFNGSVREMLEYGSEGKHSDEQLYRILERVGMKEKVDALGGLEYNVGINASKLSGGQRQRLAVGRMLLAEAEIILADEAVSALDVNGSKEISALIDETASEKTRIIVAHDLETVRDAEQIIVLDHGKVMACGRHEELLGSCPLYRGLWEGKEAAA